MTCCSCIYVYIATRIINCYLPRLKRVWAPKHYIQELAWTLWNSIKNKNPHFTEYQNIIYIYILLLRSSWFLNTFQHPCYPSVGKRAKTWTVWTPWSLHLSSLIVPMPPSCYTGSQILQSLQSEWCLFTKYYGGWHVSSVGFNQQNTGIFRHFLWRYNRDTMRIWWGNDRDNYRHLSVVPQFGRICFIPRWNLWPMGRLSFDGK